MYEVVCTKSYLDVGLCVEENNKGQPTQVLSRTSTYGSMTTEYGTNQYGNAENIIWKRTGVFLSVEEWKRISYNKSTKEILHELGIKPNPKKSFWCTLKDWFF